MRISDWSSDVCSSDLAAKGGREARIDAARDAFYKGFVAEAIDRFCRENEFMDVSGAPHAGVLSGADMAHWSATYEDPLRSEERRVGKECVREGRYGLASDK